MKHPGATQLFALFALGHVAVWTALPTALRHVTAMDATEAAAWGRRLILGYPRNPWLSAWLARGALTLGGGRDGALYLLSQLCVLLAMWCVFRLGTRLVGAWHALVAVVILAGVQYFSIAAIDFNDNVLQLALWPAAAWAFHVALATERVRAWLLTGLLCGLALMAKYSSALLLLAMLAFLAADRTARASLARRGFLACIAALAAVAAPHLLWLARHDFITVRYLFERIDSFSAPWWQEHAGYAAKFLLNQLLTLAPAAILLATLFARASDSTLAPASSPSPFDRRLLGWLFMLPLAVTATISIVTGWNLRTMWGMPLASLASLWLVCWFPVRLTARSMRRLVILASGAVLLVGGGYALAMTRPGAIRSANLPLLEVARDVTRLWRERNHTPLAYVGGERLIASYVARYSPDQPAAFFDFDAARSPWLTEAEVRARGAAFLQFVNYHDGSATFAAELRRRFPTLEIEPIRAYPWYRADRDQEPLQVLIGLLPPARHASAPRALFDGVSLAGWRATEFAGKGEVCVRDGAIVLGMGGDLTGVNYTGAVPRCDYEVSLEAMRCDGHDFFCGLTFPIGDACCSLIVGGWSGPVVGLSCIDGRDAAENSTTRYRKFESDRWYRVRLRVTAARIEAWIDNEPFVNLATEGHQLAVRAEVIASQPFGIASWRTTARVRNIELCTLPR